MLAKECHGNFNVFQLFCQLYTSVCECIRSSIKLPNVFDLGKRRNLVRPEKIWTKSGATQIKVYSIAYGICVPPKQPISRSIMKHPIRHLPLSQGYSSLFPAILSHHWRFISRSNLTFTEKIPSGNDRTVHTPKALFISHTKSSSRFSNSLAWHGRICTPVYRQRFTRPCHAS
jgi:hypothetical protein